MLWLVMVVYLNHAELLMLLRVVSTVEIQKRNVSAQHAKMIWRVLPSDGALISKVNWALRETGTQWSCPLSRFPEDRVLEVLLLLLLLLLLGHHIFIIPILFSNHRASNSNHEIWLLHCLHALLQYSSLRSLFQNTWLR